MTDNTYKVLKGIFGCLMVLFFLLGFPILGFVYGTKAYKNYKENNDYFKADYCNITKCDVNIYLGINGGSYWEKVFVYNYDSCSQTQRNILSKTKPICPTNIQCYFIKNNDGIKCDTLSLDSGGRPTQGFIMLFILSSAIILVDILILGNCIYKCYFYKSDDDIELSP